MELHTITTNKTFQEHYSGYRPLRSNTQYLRLNFSLRLSALWRKQNAFNTLLAIGLFRTNWHTRNTIEEANFLKEELSCAICLEICFEPSTTPCGHSFCKKCLRSAADKCGKRCPKCGQLISNSRSCTVNTVLWNTIQLLFPQVEARKAIGASNGR